MELPLRIDILLFSETGGFLLEVAKQNTLKIEYILTDHSCEFFKIGGTTSNQNIEINNVVNISVENAKRAWKNGLREKLL